MSEDNPGPTPKKKQLPGGSFCANAHCSNRSQRNKESKRDDRTFLKFYFIPRDTDRRKAWTARMGRDLSWKPSNHTRICSDHFELDDFNEQDLALYNAEAGLTRMRLKRDAIPNTDRATGERRIPPVSGDVTTFHRRPPKKRSTSTISTSAEVQPAVEQPAEEQPVENPLTNHQDSSKETSDQDDLQLQLDLEIIQTMEDSDDSVSEIGSVYQPDSESETDIESDNFSESDDGELYEEEFDHQYSNIDSVKHKFQWTFISFPLLLSLFDHCPQCGIRCRVTKVRTKGFAVSIHYKCYGILPHEDVWRSSPMSQRKFHCNVMFPAMASLCGLGYALLESVMSGLRMPYIGKTVFYQAVKVHLYPVIVERWVLMRDSLISSTRRQKITVSGDGHFDSPGWSAKYCTYSIMNNATGAIMDFFVVQRGMYFGDLETEGCKEVLRNLTEKGLKIKNFVSDENTKVAKMIRENFPGLFHCYDIWHKARLIKKKLTKMAVTHPDILPFIRPIVNHFWYCCQKCGGDADMLIERFHSSLLHLSGKHAWTADPFKSLKEKVDKDKLDKQKKKQTKKKTKQNEVSYPYFSKFRKCTHKTRMKHRRLRGLKWLDLKSSSFEALFKYFRDKRLCNSMRKCCRFIHTGSLEVYHNVRLKLLPKRSSYSLIRMIIGGMLTAIEVNNNLSAASKNYWKYSRSQKQYVVKKRVLKKNYSFRTEILEETLCNLKNGITSKPVLDMLRDYYIKRDIPKRMVDVEFPLGDPNSSSRSRFE